MSGPISAAEENIQNAFRTVQPKPFENAFDSQSNFNESFLGDFFVSNRSLADTPNDSKPENAPLGEQDRERRRFFRRRHPFGLFRWREARAFFRRMLFEPQKMPNE